MAGPGNVLHGIGATDRDARGKGYDGAFGLSDVFFDPNRNLENPGGPGRVGSRDAIAQGMGLCRLCLCHDRGHGFALGVRGPRPGSLWTHFAFGIDSGLMVLQTCNAKNHPRQFPEPCTPILKLTCIWRKDVGDAPWGELPSARYTLGRRSLNSSGG